MLTKPQAKEDEHKRKKTKKSPEDSTQRIAKQGCKEASLIKKGPGGGGG